MMPTPAEVLDVEEECRNTVILEVKTEESLSWRPGQFLMLGIPGVDEKPMAFSGGDDRRLVLTVEVVGPFTEACSRLEPGDIVTVRGPYGRHFEIRGPRAVIVAGGTGVAPLVPLAEELSRRGIHVTSILGGPDAGRLPRKGDLKAFSDEFVVTTEDGSEGTKGFPTDPLPDLLDEANIVYACGPEAMLESVVEICARAGVPCQVSLTRYVKCGEGVCGSCALGDGLLVCRDGPVFWAEELIGTEFGDVRRDVTGAPE